MPDMGLGGDSGGLPWWQRMLSLATGGAATLPGSQGADTVPGPRAQAPPQIPPMGKMGVFGGTPPMPPQAIPGVFSGVVDPNVGGQGQGAPAGNPVLLDAMQSFRPPHEALTGRPPGGMGLLDTLNPVPRGQQLWQRFKAANDKAFGGQPPPSGMAGIVGGGFPPVAPQQSPPPQLPPGNVQPTALNEPAQPSFGPTGPIPYFAPPQQQAANVPSPQAAPVQPPQQQMPAIPPASPVGRTQAAQGQGSPLDKYFQQMMAMQRQRQLLAMAGGLLGAPSFGQGLSRAFTNASETMAPQGDLVSRIAGAQAAGQLARQTPGNNEKDVQAAQLQGLFGKPFEPPKFQSYKAGGVDRQARITPSGRVIDDATNVPAWAHAMGFRKQDGGLTYDPAEASRSVDPRDGKVKYMMSDWKPRSIDADSAAEGER